MNAIDTSGMTADEINGADLIDDLLATEARQDAALDATNDFNNNDARAVRAVPGA